MVGYSVRTAVSLTAALLAVTTALAQQPASPVQARDAWARATPPGASTGAVYMTLIRPADDRLTGASSPVAGEASVHEMRMTGEVMHMRAVENGLALPAGKPVTLAPGGYHLMLERLKAPLKPGEAMPVHLTFQKAPPLDVTAQVQSIGAAGPGRTSAGQAAQPMMPGMHMSQ